MKEGMLEIGDQVHFRKRKGGAVSYGTVVAIQYVIRTHDGRTAANVECCSKYANEMPPRSRKARVCPSKKELSLYARLIRYAKSMFARPEEETK